MTTVYVESSAVVAWLLDQPGGWPAYDTVRTADVVFTSDLTLVECDRALYRHMALGRLSPERVASIRGELAAVSSAWQLQPMSPEVVARARERFPDDRIRSLDAIHLASALSVRMSFPDLTMITLDDRMRAVGSLLGFEVLPA